MAFQTVHAAKTLLFWTLIAALALASCQESTRGSLQANDDPLAIAPSLTPSTAFTATSSPTATPIPSFTPSETPTTTPTETSSPTITPSTTPLPTETPTPSQTPTTTPTPAPSETFTPQPTAIPTAVSLQMPILELVPNAPKPYLTTFRLVTYYGSPMGWGLGILGESARDYMTRDLKQLASQYQALSPDRYVVPTYHMVTTVADGFAGSDENYNHHVALETLEDWIAAAEEGGIAVILDLQPAHADLQEEFDRISQLLRHPHVHLALDPEFFMDEDQIPGVHLGKITAEQINSIQAQMETIALEMGLNRVLIVHQFEDRMLPDKEGIVDYPHVELVMDADGVGGKWNKIADYVQYRDEPGYEYGGIKVFLKKDLEPILTIEEIMVLEPAPVVIVYQ